MYSLWGPWEHVSPLPRLSGEPVFLPGFLGVLKACQSWAISLPREGGLSLKHVWEVMFLVLPAPLFPARL